MAEEKKRGLNTDSISYIIVYSAILVIIVAFLLAFVSQSLRPMQDSNVVLDKKKQILAALNIENLSDEDAIKAYSASIVADNIIDKSGNVVAVGKPGGETTGFVLNSTDYKNGKLALYVCSVDGKTKYVVPVYGMGLWGAIWGYIAIDDDKNTVYGAYFNHDSETAGLGAEIKDSREWQCKFKGKRIFASSPNADFSIALAVKKSSDIKNPASEVDGVTGATLTSNGVSDMLTGCLGDYKEFFLKR